MKYIIGLLLLLCVNCSRNILTYYKVGDCVIYNPNGSSWTITEVGKYSYHARSIFDPHLKTVFSFADTELLDQIDCYP